VSGDRTPTVTGLVKDECDLEIDPAVRLFHAEPGVAADDDRLELALPIRIESSTWQLKDLDGLVAPEVDHLDGRPALLAAREWQRGRAAQHLERIRIDPAAKRAPQPCPWIGATGRAGEEGLADRKLRRS